MIRVCPHSDSKCVHGMSCAYTCATDAYDGNKNLCAEQNEDRAPAPVEVERLREALRDIDACSQHSFGFSDYSMRRRCGQIARAALSRKQEPGVPTQGGEGE